MHKKNERSQTALHILGNNIKAFREQEGKSCKNFAEDIAYHRLDLANLEYGIKDIKLSTAVKIAEKLDIPLPYLFSDIFISEYLTMNVERRPGYTEDNFLFVFSQNLKECLGTKGAQAELCAAVEMDASNVSKILNGKMKNPCIATLDTLAEGVGKELSVLFSRTGQLQLVEEEEI